jgi:hypothetical protein
MLVIQNKFGLFLSRNDEEFVSFTNRIENALLFNSVTKELLNEIETTAPFLGVGLTIKNVIQ